MVLLCLGGIGLWAGCSEQKHYRLLSFFFDGVPAPQGAVSQIGPDGKVVPGGNVVLFQHKPYQEGTCQQCHGEPGALYEISALSGATCLKCHEKVPQEHVLMHGPVAASACLWCHDPHQSTERHLMRGPSASICQQCHERELLGENPPEHQSSTADCLSCHYGHGGSGRNFLRAEKDRTLPGPATAPSTQAVSLVGGRGT